MLRSAGGGITTYPGGSHLTYLFGKQAWNYLGMIFSDRSSPIDGLIDNEANWNAPSALAAWYWDGDMTLEKMFAPSLNSCDCSK